MFNNGTLHINITLPTYLDENRKIQNKDDFILIHKNYIKYIQFVEPLLIARFGSPDVFSKDGELKHLFSGGSQRCAVSRYIGVGSYDTNLMMTGKLLTDDIESMEICKRENWWYNKYHKNSGYVKLDKVGYDINFNKHYNHGVEIRIFDHIDNIHEIKNILEFLIYLGDYVLDSENSRTIEKSCNPVYNDNWNSFTENVIRFGGKIDMTCDDKMIYSNIFLHMFEKHDAVSFYEELFDYLKKRYNGNGNFSKLVMNR